MKLARTSSQFLLVFTLSSPALFYANLSISKKPVKEVRVREGFFFWGGGGGGGGGGVGGGGVGYQHKHGPFRKFKKFRNSRVAV